MYRRWPYQAREGLHNTLGEQPGRSPERGSQATEASLLPDGTQGTDHQGGLGGFGAFEAFSP